MKDSARTIVEVHILQTPAPGNLNRDDTGSPKSVVYGGTMRARVSSQAWKRPTRQMFKELLDPEDLGVRTKRVVEVLRNRIMDLQPDVDAGVAVEVAESVLKDGAGIKLSAPRVKKDADGGEIDQLDQAGYLMFVGNRQLDRLAQIAVESLSEEDANARTAAIKSQKKLIKQVLADDKAVDVALFGRMVADDTDLNVDAAAQVAHAISVQTIEPESDFFTAVDDIKQDSEEEGDSGAAMLGDVEFNAATFYRYANVDANRLNNTLGDANATAEAIKAFVKAFVVSIPQGKINTFAHATLPELVYVTVRDSQATNLIGAFERPVERNYVQHATEALVRREQELEQAYGIKPVKSWVVRLGSDTQAAEELVEKTSSLTELVDGVGQAVSAGLAQE